MREIQKPFDKISNSRFEIKSQIPDHIAVEGTSGSGKSTLLSYYESMTQCKSIPEYGDLIDWENGESFPKFPPTDGGEVIKSNSLWVKIEMRRRAELIKNANQAVSYILTDRSPLSLFSFEYAKSRQDIPAEFTNLASTYAKLSDVGLFKEPTAYIFLLPSSDTVLSRIKQRGGEDMPFLNSCATIDLIHEFLLIYARTYLSKNEYLIIDSTDLSVEDVFNSIQEFTKTRKDTSRSSGFRNFLQDVLVGNLF